MTGKKVKRILLSVLCCILCFVMIQSSAPIVFADETTGSENNETDDSKKTEEDYKEEISNLQDEQVKLQQQMTEYNNKINNIKGDKKKQQALANSIDEKISIIEESIAVGKEKIALTSNYITAKTIEIRNKEENIQETLQLFRARVKAIYMTGGYSDTTNSIMMLLGSKSVSEFLTRAEFLNRIA